MVSDDLQHASAAGGLGQPASDRSPGAAQAFSSPAGLAGVLAMFLLPIYAVGAYFSGMETLVGEVLPRPEHGPQPWPLLHRRWPAGPFRHPRLPSGQRPAAADTGGASAVWMVALGGFATVSTALSTLATRAVERGVSDEDMVEAALANMAGFDLVGAFPFYGVAFGFMVGFGQRSHRLLPARPAPRSAATSVLRPFRRQHEHPFPPRPWRWARHRVIIGGDVKAAAGSTVIAVRADLHNDEVTEFPEDAASVPRTQMLADYLDETKQDVLSFFRSIDLDDSGSIDARELQNALRGAKIANLPPWDMGRLISAIDVDGDGHINLPELDITVACLRASSPEEE